MNHSEHKADTPHDHWQVTRPPGAVSNASDTVSLQHLRCRAAPHFQPCVSNPCVPSCRSQPQPGETATGSIHAGQTPGEATLTSGNGQAQIKFESLNSNTELVMRYQSQLSSETDCVHQRRQQHRLMFRPYAHFDLQSL